MSVQKFIALPKNEIKKEIEEAAKDITTPTPFVDILKKVMGPRVFNGKKIGKRKIYKGAIIILASDQSPFYEPNPYRVFNIYYVDHLFSITMSGPEVKDIRKYVFESIERKWVRIGL